MRTTLVSFVMVLVSANALADLPPLPLSYAEGPASTVDVYANPAGTGDLLSARGATVTVYVRNWNDVPIPAYPFQDIWLDAATEFTLNMCVGGSVADASTDAEGVTTISGSLATGGYASEPLLVYLGGIPLTGSPIDIHVRTPDLDGNRVVDLRDVGLFSIDFASGTVVFRADLDADGDLDLGDIGRFALDVGQTCP